MCNFSASFAGTTGTRPGSFPARRNTRETHTWGGGGRGILTCIFRAAHVVHPTHILEPREETGTRSKASSVPGPHGWHSVSAVRPWDRGWVKSNYMGKIRLSRFSCNRNFETKCNKYESEPLMWRQKYIATSIQYRLQTIVNYQLWSTSDVACSRKREQDSLKTDLRFET